MAEQNQLSVETLEIIKKLKLDINNIDENTLKLINDILKANEENKKSLEEQAVESEHLAKLYDDQRYVLEQQSRELQAQKKTAEERFIEAKKHLATLEEGTDEYDKQSTIVNKIKEETQGIVEEQEELNEELDKMNSKGKLFGETILKWNQNFQQVIGDLANIKNGVVGIISSIDDMAGGFGFPQSVLFDFNKLAATLKAAAQEVVKSLQTVTTNTGVVLGAHNQILSQGLGAYAIANKELAESFSNLYANMNQFSSLNAKEQANLTASAAKMKNLGVDTKIYAQNLQLLNNSFGMTASASNKTLEELAQKAREAGITPQKMFADLNTSMGSLAVYGGKKALEVFVDLQKQSKALGIEISKLNGIVGDTWDTFEGAAQKAGGLNAILGGDFLNATEMLNATESERVMILKRSMEASGKNWESMDKFQKLSIMNTLGIKDKAEAEAMFGKSVSKTEADMNKRVNTETTLAQAQLAGADAMRKMELAQRGQAAAAKEMVAELQKLVRMFQSLIEGNEAAIAKFTIGAGIAMMVVKVFVGVITFFHNIHKMIDASGGAVNRSGSRMAGVVGRVGAAARQNAGGLIALGFALFLVGAGVGLAAWGFSKLVLSFKELNADQAAVALQAILYVMGGMVLAMLLMIPIIYALGAAGTAGAVGLLALGISFLLVGAGVALAGLGFLMVAKGIEILIKNGAGLIDVALALGALALGMAAMLIIMAPFAVLALFIGPGLIILAKAFLLLGLGVMLALSPINSILEKGDVKSKLEDLASGIGTLAKSIGSLSGMGVTGGLASFFVGGLDDVSEMIDDIIQSVNKMPSDINVKAKALTELSTGITAVATINSGSIDPAKSFVQEVRRLYESQTAAASQQTNMFLAMVKGISNLGDKKDKEGEVEIVLRVDDESFKAYIGTSALGQGSGKSVKGGR